MLTTYQEYCPTDPTKAITFSIEDDRIPTPTKGCICQENMQQPALVFAALSGTAETFGVPEFALSLRNLAESAPLPPIHDSVIVKVV